MGKYDTVPVVRGEGGAGGERGEKEEGGYIRGREGSEDDEC